METVYFLCSPCINEESSKTVSDAIAFCFECKEHFCKICRELHSKFPPMKDHSVIPCTHMTAFPIDILNKTFQCDLHPEERAQYYCSFHCNTFCFVCLTETHRSCSFRKLSDVSKGVKESNSFTEMQNQLAMKCKSMKNILNSKSENLSDMLRQKTEIETELSSYISRINTYLIDLIRNVKTVYDQELQKLQKDIEQARIREKELRKQRNDLEDISKFCSDDVTFLCIKEIERSFRNKEEEIENILTEPNRTDLAINGIEKIKALLINVEKLEIEPLKKHIPDDIITLSPAQLTVQSDTRTSMTGTRLTLKEHIDIAKMGVKEPVIIDCTIFKSGQIIAIEQTHTCLLEFTSSGKLYRNVKISSQALGITAIDANLFALTESGRDTVQIYNKQRMSSIFEVSIRDHCSGITKYSDSNVVVGCNAGGLVLIGKNGEKEKVFHTKELMHLNQNICLTSNEKGQIFCSFSKNNTVLSIDSRGKLRFTFESDKLRSPRGVTGDGNNNIFVSGYDTNNIIWISNDGKNSKEVLNSRNGIQNPRGIDYDKILKVLTVCNKNGSQMSIYSMQ
ncbi:uncharacterized protein LOC127711483 [Mytilus californianus]|uniref:uncharacterized protein LOC127711483 n=1 Tax=Mytilus californianus TaxID=6549 RepID=UPI00224586F0|nr:uncharacterized protein LOC127711483 [Mytilus californianus]XP_052073513.1 uncharacterized protein LOC127711483 [Mytilus californianus]